MRRLFLNGETVTAQRGSWALPPIGNSPALCAAQVAPCPEGLYLIDVIITQVVWAERRSAHTKLLQLCLDLPSCIFIRCQFIAFLLNQRGGGFIGEIAAKQILESLNV